MGRHSLVAGSPAVDIGLWETANPAMSCASTGYNSGDEVSIATNLTWRMDRITSVPLWIVGTFLSNRCIRLMTHIVAWQVMVLFRHATRR